VGQLWRNSGQPSTLSQPLALIFLVNVVIHFVAYHKLPGLSPPNSLNSAVTLCVNARLILRIGRAVDTDSTREGRSCFRYAVVSSRRHIASLLRSQLITSSVVAQQQPRPFPWPICARFFERATEAAQLIRSHEHRRAVAVTENVKFSRHCERKLFRIPRLFFAPAEAAGEILIQVVMVDGAALATVTFGMARDSGAKFFLIE